MRHLLRFAATVSVVMLLAPTGGCGHKSRPAAPPRVKNVILMVGDGMGLAQVSALMLAGEYRPVNLERATTGGFVKTHSADNRVTDSAAAGTAYATGHKTRNGYLGVDPDGNPLETIIDRAERAGLSTGLVATVEIQHATPGAFYGHSRQRYDYESVSLDLLTSGVDVAIAGGRRYLTDRKDGRDLVAELRAQGYFMTDSLAGLDGVTSGPAMALCEDALPFVSEGRDPEYLTRATAKALGILTANTPRTEGGFFLMVEGSLIDYAGHDKNTEALIGEMRDFDAAVGVAFDYADAHPGTLVVVLADHETGGLTIPAGKEDFTLPDSGVEFRWSTGGHTASMVPMFAYGAQAGLVGGVFDNTEVNRLLTQLLGVE
ncbi:MAG: alkaline phosphatase [Alistipes sp.]|jgi:alkaline phosphatase|nr:alkaline phosphatase [Alistipes sp.]